MNNVPVVGMYCRKHVGDTQIMNCRTCKVLWSPCCGEAHQCVVPGNGADLAIPAERVFRRDEVIKVTFQGSEVPRVESGPAPTHEPLDWLGWEL